MFDRLAQTIDDAKRMLRQNPRVFAAPLLLYTVAGSAIDIDSLLRPDGTPIPLFVINIVTQLLVQLWVTRLALARLGCRPAATGARFGTAFVASLLSSLGVLLGLILLILPGIYLLGRWALVFPVLMNERIGAIDAMRRSNALTPGIWGTALVCMVLPMLVGFGALIPVWAYPTQQTVMIALLVAAEGLAALAIIWSTVALSILYVAVIGREQQSAENFRLTP